VLVVLAAEAMCPQPTHQVEAVVVVAFCKQQSIYLLQLMQLILVQAVRL
jgi:hypothetical protein